MTPEVRYDAETDALFVRLGEGQSRETVAATESVNLDFDAHGRLLGLEILSASRIAPGLVDAAARQAIAAE